MVIGGMNSQSRSTNDVQIINLHGDKAPNCPNATKYPRPLGDVSHSGVYIDNKVIICGRDQYRECYKFPGGQWENGQWSQYASLRTERRNYALVAMHNKSMIAIGGYPSTQSKFNLNLFAQLDHSFLDDALTQANFAFQPLTS